MTEVALTEHVGTGVQTSNPSGSTTILFSAPSGKGSVIHAQSDEHSGAYISNGDEHPPSDPVLLPLSSVQADLDLDQKERYQKEKRVIVMFFILLWNSFFALFYIEMGSTVFTIIMLVYWFLHLALCMVIWIVYVTRIRSELSDTTFKEYLNNFLFVKHTSSEHDKFEMQGKCYIGLWCFWAIIYHSAVQIFVCIWYLVNGTTTADFMFTYTQCMTPCAVGAISMLFMYSVTPRCVEVMDERLDILSNRYPKFELKAKHQSILKKLEKEMEEESQLVFKPWHFISIYILVLSVLVTSPIFDWGLYNDGWYLIKWDALNEYKGDDDAPERSTFAQVFMWPMFMADAIPWTFWFYFYGWIHRHFTFPGRLMDLLNEQLVNGDPPKSIPGFIQELTAWWELRSHFMRCTIQVYTWAISPLIAVLLVVVVILFGIIFIFLLSDIRGDNEDYWDCLVMAIYAWAACNIMLLMVKNAADYHMKQLDHIPTLKRKLLVVQRDELMKKYTCDELMSRLYPTVVHSIMEDMEEHYDAIRVFGFLLDNNFMLFLKSAVSFVVLSLFVVMLEIFFDTN